MIRGALTLSMLVLALTLALPVFAAHHEGKAHDSMKGDDKMAAMEGTVICVQVDESGDVQTMSEFTECTGTIVMVGSDKAAAIAAKKDDMKGMKGGKQTVNGEISGHTRGWILGTASALDESGAKEASVSGTIVCLLPNYEEGSVAPVVATGPCGEKDQHLHVVTTSGGQVYALHGSEEAISKLESSTDRNNVELQGKVQGDQGAWVLYVN